MEEFIKSVQELRDDYDALSEARRQICEEFPDCDTNGPEYNEAVRTRWTEIIK